MTAIFMDEKAVKRYCDLLTSITEAQRRLSGVSEKLSAITKLVEADQLLNKYSSLIYDEVLGILPEVPELFNWANHISEEKLNKNQETFKGMHDDAVQSIVEKQGSKGTTPHFIAKIASNEGRSIGDSSARKSLNRLKSRGIVIDRAGRWFSVATK